MVINLKVLNCFLKTLHLHVIKPPDVIHTTTWSQWTHVFSYFIARSRYSLAHSTDAFWGLSTKDGLSCSSFRPLQGHRCTPKMYSCSLVTSEGHNWLNGVGISFFFFNKYIPGPLLGTKSNWTVGCLVSPCQGLWCSLIYFICKCAGKWDRVDLVIFCIWKFGSGLGEDCRDLEHLICFWSWNQLVP